MVLHVKDCPVCGTTKGRRDTMPCFRCLGRSDVTMVAVPMDRFQTYLLQSFRYCLGRMTYAVSTCVEDLARHWNVLPVALQEQIQDDIRKAIERGGAGMDIDVRQWDKILQLPIEGKNHG